MKRKHFWLTGVIVVVVVVCAAFLLTRADQIPMAYAAEANMQATVSDTAGVDTTSAFSIDFTGKVSAAAVRNSLAIEPDIEVSVHQGNNNQQILIVPTQALDANTVYKFLLDTDGQQLSWAFTTKSSLKVSSTLPANETTNVPVNSGIEIYFNSDKVGDITSYFNIEPFVNGTFKQEGNRVVYIPDGKLQPNTIYTVTIKSGLPLDGSDSKLAEDYVFAFQTQIEEKESYWGFDSQPMSFKTDEIPHFNIYVDWVASSSQSPVSVKVYAYASATDFAGALIKNEKSKPYWAYNRDSIISTDKNSLQKVLDITTELSFNEENYSSRLQLPDILAPGYYLLSVQRNGETRELLFQVSDLNAFALPAEKEIVVWLHDGKGLAVADAAVREYNGGNNGRTDSQGLLTMRISNKKDDTFDGGYRQTKAYIIEKDDKSLVLFDNNYYWLDNSVPAEYWSYVYCDRSLYKANDELKLWGFVQAKKGYDDLPRVRVSIFRNYDTESAVLYDIIPVENQTFSSTISLPTLASGYYTLRVTYGDKVLAERWFRVADYIKPTYTLNSQPQSEVVMAGEEAVFNIYAKGFEDTPLPDLAINYDLNSAHKGESKTVKTDSKGYVKITSPTPANTKDEGPQGYYPLIQGCYLYAWAKGPESGSIYVQDSIEILQGDLYVQTESEIKDDKAHINGTVYNTTLAKVKEDGQLYHDTADFLSDVAAGQKVVVKYYRNDWLRKQTGQTYDDINKVTTPIYRYDNQYTLIEEKTVTSDAKGKIALDFDFTYGKPAKDWGPEWELIEKGSSFQVDLIVTDADGRIVKSNCYFYPTPLDIYGQYDYYYLNVDKEKGYNLDELYSVTMYKNNGQMEDRKNSFLFITERNGIKEAKIQDSPTFSGKFLPEYIPNIWVSGVYYDGNYYSAAYPVDVAVSVEQFALNIDISTDAEKYKPGDTAEVSVNVTDSNGSGQKATVLISVVDEALFAISENKGDILKSLYENYVPSGVGRYLISHLAKDELYGGEGGAGAGADNGFMEEYIRDYFADSVIFEQIITDKNGKGKVSFQLPDNITAWRVTALAVVTDNKQATSVKAGDSEGEIISTLPFWGEVIANNKYLAGDAPTIFLRALGQGLSGQVDYSVTLQNAETEATVKQYAASGQINQRTALDLGVLKAGEYNLLVQIKSDNGLTDALSQPLTVQKSFQLVNLSDQADLSAKPDIDYSDTYPTLVVFSSKYRGNVLCDLWSLDGKDSARVETRLASMIANKLLTEYDSEHFKAATEADNDLSIYQKDDGGIAILPYGSSDLLASVQAAALDGQYFDKGLLKSYFYSIIQKQSSREDNLLAMAGLASLGEPVLQNLKNAMDVEGLSSEEQLYILWGMVQSGDKQPAGQLFSQYLQKYSQVSGNSMSIVGDDKSITATGQRVSIAALIAADCGNYDNYFLLRNYLLNVSSTQVPPDLILAMGSQEILPKLNLNDISFTYKLNGENRIVTLQGQKDFSLWLLPEQMKNISFSDIGGQISISSFYQGVSDAKSTATGKISRAYKVLNKNESDSPIQSSSYKITLSYDLPANLPQGCYTITDFMPAGLRFFSAQPLDIAYDTYLYPLYTDGQRVSFTIYKAAGEAVSGSVYYYARVVSGGSFEAESALMTYDGSNEIFAQSGDYQLNIK
jgi:hypothetical protein